jgi:glutathione synthase/RimK-type ligase-like ATP-grasp enzyme
MNLLVLSPKCSEDSASKLARSLKAEILNPFNTQKRDFQEYDLVINYGCNRNFLYKNILNAPKAVACCVNKLTTIDHLKKANLPTVNYVLSKEAVPKEWDHIVIHEKANGNQGEGVTWTTRKSLDKFPNAAFYSQYFYHRKEFRIVCFQETAYAYEKVREGTEWHLILREYQYLTPMLKACQEAKKALAIDFVGFDVLVNDENEFAIIEANSGPIMTDEILGAFKEYILNLERGNV